MWRKQIGGSFETQARDYGIGLERRMAGRMKKKCKQITEYLGKNL